MEEVAELNANAATTGGSLLWSADPHVQAVLGVILLLAAGSVLAIYLPFTWRLFGIAQLRREVSSVLGSDEATRLQALRGKVDDAFLRSVLAPQWEIFLARWRSSAVSGSGEERAPVRLLDVFEESPALPTGARKNLLSALPGLFLASGTLGALVAIALAIPSASQLDTLQFDLQMNALASSIEMALTTALWGLILSMASALGTRLLEGRFDWHSEQLDLFVNCVYPYAPAADLLSPRAPIAAPASNLKSEIGELLDARFAVQSAAIRSLQQQLAAVGDPATTGELPGAGGELAETLAQLRSAAETLERTAAGGESRPAAGDDWGQQEADLGAAAADLRSIATALRESLGAAGEAERNAVAQRSLIEEELGRLSDVLVQRLSPIQQELESLRHDAAASQAGTIGTELTAALDRMRLALDGQLAPLQTRFDEIGAELRSLAERSTSDVDNESQRAALDQGLDRVAGSINERFDPIEARLEQLTSDLAVLAGADAAVEQLGEEHRAALDEGVARLNESTGERLSAIEARLETIATRVPDRPTDALPVGALQGLAAELRGVADDFAKAFAPADQLISQLDRRSEDLKEALRDLKDRSAPVEGPDPSALLERLEGLIADLASRSQDEEVAASTPVNEKRVSSVQRALERARRAASGDRQPPANEPETAIHTAVRAVPATEDVDTVRVPATPKSEPAAVSEPEGARPPGLASLLSSKRARRD